MAADNEAKKTELSVVQELDVIPVLPLRDVVVFPHMVIPLFVGREQSINAIQHAMLNQQKIWLVSQKASKHDEPKAQDLYQVGTLAKILQLLKLPDGTLKILVEGELRATSVQFKSNKKFLLAEIKVLSEETVPQNKENDIWVRALISQFEQYIRLNGKIPPEVLTAVQGIDDPARLTDTIAAHLLIKNEDRQKILEQLNVAKRIRDIITILETEIDLLQLEKRIRTQVKRQMEKTQREYYLNEQMKAIQKELGEVTEEGDEFQQLENAIKKAGMPPDAKIKAMMELKKFKLMQPMSAEATVVRSYLDCLISYPWKKQTKVKFDLLKAKQILDHDHFGLEKIKERILEYLAVQKRVAVAKGPILCFVGPPGVGKTSLGQSIANATGRKFIRIALGGVRDEAEIRGHRRTYIGSMPGKIIQKIIKSKVNNPLIMLDEIDKMAMDFRGDPAAALLEVLDPEQNNVFNDHYLEGVDIDLSHVLFIATANSLEIPVPLLDRMEVIRLPGYTEDEKVNIADQYLIPKQISLNGLKSREIKILDSVLHEIIQSYTREAGVRNLEREIASICRKVVKKLLTNNKIKSIKITPKNLQEFLGIKKYKIGMASKESRIGQVTGLAWTSVGGELLTIEAAMMPGKGKITQTGQLGEVMQESIQAALTVVRCLPETQKLSENFFEKHDFHIHVPEGATPKDGPSAGIAMCVALASVVLQKPVSSEVAMTGEITLRGEVLAIGGLKEKLLAAHRGGIKTVIIPEENRKDLDDIPQNLKDAIKIQFVNKISEVFDVSLQNYNKIQPKTKKIKKITVKHLQ